MKAFLLALMFLQAAPTGVVTGIVRGADGKPAAGVRVYAMAVREGNDAPKDATALESIAQTDESGKYRLEVPAGRYYIAAGSVDQPTYFPGTSSLAAAKVISITSAATIESIDFGSFVPPAAAPFGGGFAFPLTGTGVISGVIRYPDGTPAADIPVAAIPPDQLKGNGSGGNIGTSSVSVAGIPQSLVCMRSILLSNPASAGAALTSAVISCMSATRTDRAGRYRLPNVTPGTYHIVTGFSHQPNISPNTVTTTNSSNIANFDLTIPLPATGTTVGGKVVGAEGVPVRGATIELRVRSQMTGLALPTLPPMQAISGPDGGFELRGVPEGTYNVRAMLSGSSPVESTLIVANQPIADLQFAFPVAVLVGQVLSEDGSPFPDAEALRAVAVDTVKNSNLIQTTAVLSIDAAGRFSRVLEANEYRVYIRVLPNEYVIKSMKAGSTDLMTDTLKISGGSPAHVEIRLAKRTGQTGLKLSGRIIDSITGAPTRARRIELCCRLTDPFETISAPISPDGTFEVNGIPPGHYTADLRANPLLYLTEHSIDVQDRDVSGITLASTSQLIPVQIQLKLESGRLPPGIRVGVALTGSAGVAIPADSYADVGGTVWVSDGDTYTVSATKVPAGYIVKSINGNRISVAAASRAPVPPIVITLERTP